MTQTEEFIQHYGVKGMRWGVRRARNAIKNKKADVKRRVTEKKRAKIQKDIDSLKSNKKNMLALKSKNGKSLFTEKDIDSMISALEATKSKIKDGSRK